MPQRQELKGGCTVGRCGVLSEVTVYALIRNGAASEVELPELQRSRRLKGVVNCFASSLKQHIDNYVRNKSKVHSNSGHAIKYP